MPKILLISSSFEDISLVTASKNKAVGAKTTDESHYPLGLGYLHSYLEHDGNEVTTLFLNNHDFDYCLGQVHKTMAEFDPDIVGLQILTANRISSFKLIEFLQQTYPKTIILAGGIHATIMYEQIIKRYPKVTIIMGEGEKTLSEIAFLVKNNQVDFSNIDGIAHWQDGAVRTTRPRALIENLDELPFPKHEIFLNEHRTVANILTSRGCPFNCSFCCLDILSQHKTRKRSVENVIAEIIWLKEKYPKLKSIWIHDDTFFIDNDRVIRFCDEIIRLNLGLSFTCSGRVKPLSELMVHKLEQANFKKILFGLESGDNGILNTCHKAITQNDVEIAFKLFANSKISIYAFLIVGLPGESTKTIKETSRFIQKLQKIRYIHYNEDVAILSVYPGTEIYEIFKTAGKISDDFWLTEAPVPLFTLEHDADELIILKEQLLNSISLDRLFTLNGLTAQLTMLPQIIRYSFANKSTLKALLLNLLKALMPNSTYDWLKTTIKKITPNQ